MGIIVRIKSAYVRFLYLLCCIKWYGNFLKTLSSQRKPNYHKSNMWYQTGRLLLIAPHADDELLSSYTLLKYCPDITIYYCGFTGSNNNEINKKVRQSEIETLCTLMDIPLIYGGGTCNNLKEIVVNYDTVVIPSIIDWHKEHRLVNYILYDIMQGMKKCPNIYSYAVTVPIESNRIIIANLLDKNDQREKYQLFHKVYISQKFMPIIRFRINERINGYHANAFAAETFLHYPIEKWRKEIKYVRNAELQRNVELMKLINDIKKLGNIQRVRMVSHKLYSLVESNE